MSDLRTMTPARTVSVGKAPQEIVIRPDSAAAYGPCAESGTVSVIDLSNWTAGAAVATGPGADGMACAGR